MDYFFINTDADSFKGRHDLSTWFKRKLAFTGGEYSFGQQLAQLKPGDICLMYENRIGVVGMGRVLEKWNRKAYDAPIYYVGQDAVGRDGIDQNGFEYRVSVDWFCDLRSSPISLGEIKNRFGYVPRGAVKRIVKHQEQVKGMVAEWQSGESFPEELPGDPEGVPEGAKKKVWVNAYERSDKARQRCIKAWGFKCSVCGVSMQDIYGSLTMGFIHVHHLIPISQIKAEYIVDPVNDMRPVCPN